MDWSEPYIKLEQAHKELKDALNQERYEDAEDLLYLMLYNNEELLKFVENKIKS